MAHILFVHGMNIERRSREVFEQRWFGALAENLRAAYPDRVDSLPTAADCSLLYWTDMLPPYEDWAKHTKGVFEPPADFEHMAADALRKALRFMAEHTSFDPSDVKQWVTKARLQFEQSVLYMNNLMELQSRVQAQFKKLLRPDTCVVIGHSLGSVIAYQGLLSQLHSVDLFLTMGSPLGTPKLIYERLTPHDWPNVKRWCNFSAVADVWSVPTPALGGLFRGPVRDIEVRHGSLLDASTHRLDKYLAHHEVLSEIERSWREATAPRG